MADEATSAAPAAVRFVVLGGPTAAGKSALGVQLAERFGGEIVNADSRQVFRYLDIGTAKPTGEERERVTHHLLDVVDPSDSFDVADYSALARRAVREIASRGRVPIVVGGSGLYIRALRGGLLEGPRARPRLREFLERSEEASPGLLHRWCQRLDPGVAGRVHERDRVRLIRALEVVFVEGRSLSRLQTEHRFGDTLGPSLFLVIDPGREVLGSKIAERSRKMFSRGLVEELRELRERGYDPRLRVLQSIGYREAANVLDGFRSEADALEDLVRATLRFAKRQRTWFRAEASAHAASDPDAAAALVESFLAVGDRDSQQPPR